MEEYTNKFMQVFNTYDDFAQHSADYQKGEDHIAYLIQENEVIYWLYLEQVWRPLNVRTTKTGELEDGRTKVAVRLEYVEGGQKYTSVPNIPDPERITSMSHFLEDYPDIEEVNVSGTTNLTDLSYAFAGSKIRDFSMLDTSNVDNISYMLENVDNNLDITINTNSSNLNHYNVIKSANINSLTINASNNLNMDYLSSVNYPTKIKSVKCIFNDNIDDYEHNIDVTNFNENVFTNIENITHPYVHINCGYIKYNHNVNINAKKCVINWFRNGTTIGNTYNINAEKIIFNIKDNLSASFNINAINTKEIEISESYTGGFKFGYGLNKNDAKLTFRNKIGSLLYYFDVTDEVNNDYVNKYSDVKTVYLRQYKTLYKETANINITEKPLNARIVLSNDNKSNLIDIVIKNKINIDNVITGFNKLIIDNSGFNFSKEDAPTIDAYSGPIAEYKEDSYIKGVYKIMNDSYNNVSAINAIYKDIYLYVNYVDINIGIKLIDNIINTNNIKIEYTNYINLIIDNIGSNNIQIKNLFDNDIHIALNNDTIYEYKSINKAIEYIEDKKLNIYKLHEVPCITPFINYCIKENNVYFHNAGDLTFQASFNSYDIHKIIMFDSEYYDEEYYNNFPNIYLYCDDNSYIKDFVVNLRYVYNTNRSDFGNYIKTKHIYGNINLILPSYITTLNIKDVSYIHIDINKVKAYDSQTSIIYFNNLDNETTINLITKLIDNTSESTKTIYMYRSQANIIGDDNIAAAVAKNYEFAIIEN